MNQFYVITGATGWVGRNILHELQLKISNKEFNDKVIAFGSKNQTIKSTAYPDNKSLVIPIYPLELSSKIIPNNSKLLVVHTAFLTREKIKYVGVNNYINTNESIIRNIKSIINTSLESKIVLISSGAASSVMEDEILNRESLLKDPYGNLKRKEEIELSKICECLTLRIYGLTGRFIRDPSIFAFGNFLLQAKSKTAIKISSKAKVIRSYCYAGDVARLSINWLQNSLLIGNKAIPAVSDTIDLLTLANLISNMYNLPPVEHEINEALPSNIYVATEADYFSLLLKFKQKPTDLIDQIKSTKDFIEDL